MKEKHIEAINDILNDMINSKDVHKIYPLVKKRIEYLQRCDALKYSPGQRVEFIHNNIIISGTIERINIKTLTLKDCSDGNIRGWRVSLSRIDRIL